MCWCPCHDAGLTPGETLVVTFLRLALQSPFRSMRGRTAAAVLSARHRLSSRTRAPTAITAMPTAATAPRIFGVDGRSLCLRAIQGIAASPPTISNTPRNRGRVLTSVLTFSDSPNHIQTSRKLIVER
jgi:hypothetical protein